MTPDGLPKIINLYMLCVLRNLFKKIFLSFLIKMYRYKSDYKKSMIILSSLLSVVLSVGVLP